MNYRPYPNADRARRQVARHHVPQPVPPSEFTLKLAAQANAVLAAVSEALRPVREQLQAKGAPGDASFTAQVAFVMGKQLEADCARSVPGVLALHQMAQAMRRPA